MGYFVQAIVADFQGDKAKAEAARADFRKHYDAEIAKKRDEYEAHRALLESLQDRPEPQVMTHAPFTSPIRPTPTTPSCSTPSPRGRSTPAT